MNDLETYPSLPKAIRLARIRNRLQLGVGFVADFGVAQLGLALIDLQDCGQYRIDTDNARYWRLEQAPLM